MNKIKSNRKYIFIIIATILVCLWGYAKISCIRVVNEFQKQIEIKPLPTYTSIDGKEQLIENGYSIIDEVIGHEYSEDSHYYTAIKDNSIIDVKAEPLHWVGYYFKHSEESITPIIYDIKFGDSYETVKEKLGINHVNTLFQKIGMLNPGIYTLDKFYILFSQGEWKYEFRFDNQNCLEQIEIQNFDVYD